MINDELHGRPHPAHPQPGALRSLARDIQQDHWFQCAPTRRDAYGQAHAMTCASCPAAADGPLCRDCRWATRQEIAALPLDYRDLAALTPPAGRSSVRVSGTRTPQVPLDLHADTLMREIVWKLSVWEPPVREAAALPPAPERGVRPARLVTRAARLLSAHLSDFCALGPTWGYPDGLTGGCVARSGLYGVLSLRQVHARCLSVLDLAPPPATRLPGLCAACGAPALVHTPGTTRIHCAHCGQDITGDEYQNAILLGSSPERVKHAAATPGIPSGP